MDRMLLIDGDLILHRMCAAAETEIDWGDDIVTIHTKLDEIRATVTLMVNNYVKETKSDSFLVVFSDKNNFRKGLDPSYKAHRKGRKPVGYVPARDWMRETFECKSIPGLEADDVMGIIATKPNPKFLFGICSDDKDMMQIPGYLYRPMSKTLMRISQEEADYYHLYQTLCGDQSDGYPGCPGVGDVTATKILMKGGWEAVLEAFEHKGLDYDEALLQARLAKILRYEDFDRKKRKPILWKPSTSTVNTAAKTTLESPAKASVSSPTARTGSTKKTTRKATTKGSRRAATPVSTTSRSKKSASTATRSPKSVKRVKR